MLHQCRNAAWVWQCQLLEGGSGVVVWDGSGALNRVCFSDRGGGVGAVPAGPRRCWQQGGDGSVPECWVPCGEGNLPGAFSLRYRSSATFPFPVGSFSSLLCLWKKPSWEEDEGGGRTEVEKDRWELDNSYNINAQDHRCKNMWRSNQIPLLLPI